MKVTTATALVAWAATALAYPKVRSALRGSCPGLEDIQALGRKLSSTAHIYFPGSDEFVLASKRWSQLEAPKVDIVVVPGTERDVSETVIFANNRNVPFLAFNTAHGAITTLGQMTHGIEIWLNQLSGVQISSDGKTAKIAGGTQSKVLIDTLWANGKQAVTGTCECVSYMGPALGGGHGWLQGHHGLIADQFVSVNIVLADGTLRTINANSDLWWAIKGAGHNFGIVTSATVKIFDIEHTNWAVETFIFSGDKVEEVYQAANDHLLKNGTQPVGVINWSYWLNNPDADTEKPIILFWVIQEGVTSVDPIYTQPFHNIGPIVAEPSSGSYLDVSTWTGISLDAAPCQKAGFANPRFPLYLKSYNVSAQRQAYDLFASSIGGFGSTPFSNSLFMFEGYSMQGVQAIDSQSSAFAFRQDNLLTAPLITYEPAGSQLDAQAAALGSQLRQILFEASGQDVMHTYVNYAFGNENPSQWYGSEAWRQNRLKQLKNKYDPKRKFSFYGPIA
ncbi:FAD-dependent oxygenase [Scedosporium apiospermum]|uniref:FAD-dependent oxygenase n=1 Tax=Pseudallescheria apiosperma TaxID=563466 RepID=A0A084G679_PSEDA|nr:FAD-dependent oxygenase [Scedosporium apiospermum]KEZ42841.1 FAD-dependent oxygenase [Scedosporium apiospermum]